MASCFSWAASSDIMHICYLDTTYLKKKKKGANKCVQYVIIGSLLHHGLFKLNRRASLSGEFSISCIHSLKGTLNIQPSHLMRKRKR